MVRFARFAFLAVTLFVAACAQQAPPYSFAPSNVQTLKDSGSGKLRLGAFTATGQAQAAKAIGLRGSSMSSPYGDYPAYLKEAFRQELGEAGRLAPDAVVELSGVVSRNDINTGVMVVADGFLEARIVVTRAGGTVFDKQVAARTSWDTNYFGAVAIPRAIAEYPKLVSAFIAALLQDQDFLAAIR
jgi:hypothetical protein